MSWTNFLKKLLGLETPAAKEVSPEVQEILRQAEEAGHQAARDYDAAHAAGEEPAEPCYPDDSTGSSSGLDYDPKYGDPNLTADEEEWEEWDSFKRLEKK
jgi:hypothetical protein